MLHRAERNETLTYSSKDEQKCSIILQKFLDWSPTLGKTFQFPITSKHCADFYIPDKNAIVEFHPPVIKWYAAKGVYSRLQRLTSQLDPKKSAELVELFSEQISHEYFKKRRSLMDMSPIPGVNRMRLIVCTDFNDVFQMVVQPYSRNNINYTTYKNVIDKIKC